MNLLYQLRVGIEGLTAEGIDQQKSHLLKILASIETPPAEAHSTNGHRRLSPRELEVMTMILEGQRLKEIAARLEISVKTVTTHRSRLLKKLGVADNLGLYRYGVRNGLISV